MSIYLENNDFETVKAESGYVALEIIYKEKIDLAILDVMMPDMDGIMLCIKIREKTNMPIIMLSAKDHHMDKVMGLTCGADDYIAKPFNPIELLARVRAQLRRFNELNPVQMNSEVLKYDDFILNFTLLYYCLYLYFLLFTEEVYVIHGKILIIVMCKQGEFYL